jgi:hypothetical protein
VIKALDGLNLGSAPSLIADLSICASRFVDVKGS